MKFLCRPFKGARPTEAQWHALIAGLETLRRREGVDLIAIDSLATLLPGYAEMCAPKLLDCLLPVQALAGLGTAVVLVHHPAKGKRLDGQAGRGSIALEGCANIVMEMSYCRRARSRDRRRRICSFSHYVETPRHLILELNADGADYTVGTDDAGVPLVRQWPEVLDILATASNKLSQEKILMYWPRSEKDEPDRSTLSRWLKRAAQQGLICCSGGGLRGDGFVYWIPGREPLLWPGDNASLAEQEAWRQRCDEHAQKRKAAASA